MGPVAVYSCDAAGVIVEFNRRAVELWVASRYSAIPDTRFAARLSCSVQTGTFMPHEQCPMVEVVAGKLTEASDAEVLMERPDGSDVLARRTSSVVATFSRRKNLQPDRRPMAWRPSDPFGETVERRRVPYWYAACS